MTICIDTLHWLVIALTRDIVVELDHINEFGLFTKFREVSFNILGMPTENACFFISRWYIYKHNPIPSLGMT